MLSLYTQDATLNWFKGQPFPPPPAELWMSLHSDVEATDSADVSAALGGRIRVPQDFLSEPIYLDGETSGTRQIVNTRSALSDLATADAFIASFALWDSPSGGIRLISGTVTPATQVLNGDPAILLQGELSIRMT